MRVTCCFVALLAAALSLPGQTAGPISKEGRYWVQTEEGVLAVGTGLRVNSVGSISVTGGEGREVRYSVRKRLRARNAEEAEELLGAARLTASRNGGMAVLTITPPECFRCDFFALLEIQAPRATQQVVLNTQAGSVTVEDVTGSADVDTAGGSIDMNGVGGDVRAVTAGGNIEMGSIGGQVRAKTAGGSISLKSSGGQAVLETSGGSITAGEVGGRLLAETFGGNIRVERVRGPVTAGTAGGGIHIGEAEGVVDVETAGGSIHVDSAPAGIQADTAGGRIQLQNVAGAVHAASAAGNIQAVFLAGRPLKNCFLETNVGSIVVTIPDSLAVTVDAMVDLAGGLDRIRSEFETIKITRQEGFGPGSISAQGDLNGGGPRLRIRNTSGRIHIRRRE